jgi:hypothetical protein
MEMEEFFAMVIFVAFFIAVIFVVIAIDESGRQTIQERISSSASQSAV